MLSSYAQPLITLIAFAFAATDAVGAFVVATTIPAMESAISSTLWGWLGRLVILTATILVTVFTIWEIIMGFTNQIFKWIGDVANDLGENKANTMFVGVAGQAKSASTGMANASAMKQAGPKTGKEKEENPEESTQAVDNDK